jgi:hypothetical protein
VSQSCCDCLPNSARLLNAELLGLAWPCSRSVSTEIAPSPCSSQILTDTTQEYKISRVVYPLISHEVYEDAATSGRHNIPEAEPIQAALELEARIGKVQDVLIEELT